MSVRLLLVRHGQTEENVAHVLQGQTPGKLTDKGKQQAEELAQKLVNVPIHIIISSDLKRAVDTATIINKQLRLPHSTDILLRERNLGPYTGKSYGIEINPELPDVESVEQLYERANTWLQKMSKDYEGKNVLVISHGLFLRVVQGAFYHKTIREIDPMDNTEIREINLEANWNYQKSNELGDLGSKEA